MDAVQLETNKSSHEKYALIVFFTQDFNRTNYSQVIDMLYLQFGISKNYTRSNRSCEADLKINLFLLIFDKRSEENFTHFQEEKVF